MNWGSLEAFLDMGGYALYVWSSFAACLVVAIGELWLVRGRHRKIVERLRSQRSLQGENTE
jgi:heme exporter protein D